LAYTTKDVLEARLATQEPSKHLSSSLCSFWQTPKNPHLADHSTSEYKRNLDIAVLNSQRTIKTIKIGDQIKGCLVIGARPDGDCGFTAIRQSLIVQGYKELAQSFYRDAFIALIDTLYNDSEADNSAYHPYIEKIFTADGALNWQEWKERFKSSGYWLEEAHFKFLSFCFDISFNFYCLLPDNQENIFEPIPTYESIHERPDVVNKVISLAYVKTKMEANLNHFDTIIVEPTETLEELENKLKQFGEKVLLPEDYSPKLM
jgi:hypothetical protein